VTFFHLAIYGELFGPDLDIFLNNDTTVRQLSVETRLEYVKYCINDFATELSRDWDKEVETGLVDPRRAVHQTGPYARPPEGENYYQEYNHNVALTWVLNSSRWRPHWQAARARAGPDFQSPFQDGWWTDEEDTTTPEHWRQRLWENAMVCQGLEGLGMIRQEHQERWRPKIEKWRRQIALLEAPPGRVTVGRQNTMECIPYILGDLRICASGYVMGT
jgi:hypothetical protein